MSQIPLEHITEEFTSDPILIIGEKCPECGSEIIENSGDAKCSNPKCTVYFPYQ